MLIFNNNWIHYLATVFKQKVRKLILFFILRQKVAEKKKMRRPTALNLTIFTAFTLAVATQARVAEDVENAPTAFLIRQDGVSDAIQHAFRRDTYPKGKSGKKSERSPDGCRPRTPCGHSPGGTYYKPGSPRTPGGHSPGGHYYRPRTPRSAKGHSPGGSYHNSGGLSPGGTCHKPGPPTSPGGGGGGGGGGYSVTREPPPKTSENTKGPSITTTPGASYVPPDTKSSAYTATPSTTLSKTNLYSGASQNLGSVSYLAAAAGVLTLFI